MVSTQWDPWVDYHRTDGEGITHTSIKDLERPRTLQRGMFVMVGNEEADAAVAEVVAVESDGLVLVRVLQGAVEDHVELVEHPRSS